MPSDKWMITDREAIEMFARQFEARHRAGAIDRAKERAHSLRVIGDHAGHMTWATIASAIEALRHPSRLAARRAQEEP